MVRGFSARVGFFCFFLSFACFCHDGGGSRFTRRQHKTKSIQMKNNWKIEQGRWTPNDSDDALSKIYRLKNRGAGTGREESRMNKGRLKSFAEEDILEPKPSNRKNKRKKLLTPLFHPYGEWHKFVAKNTPALEFRSFHNAGQKADGENFVSSTAQHFRKRRDTSAVSESEVDPNECSNYTFTIKYEDEYRVWNNFSIIYRGQMYYYYQYRLTNHGLVVCHSFDQSVQQSWAQSTHFEKEDMAYKRCNVSVDGFFWANFTLYKNFSVFLPATKQLFNHYDYGVFGTYLIICSAKLSLSCNYHLFKVNYGEQYFVWKNFSLFYNNKMYDYNEYRFSSDTLELCTSSDSRVQAIWRTTISWEKLIMGAFYCGVDQGTIKTIFLKYYAVSKQFTLYAAGSAQFFEKDEYMVQSPGTLAICDVNLKPETSNFTAEDMTVCNDSVVRIDYDDDYVVRKDFSLVYKDKVYGYTDYRVLNDSIKICNSTDEFVRNVWKLRNFYVKQFRHREYCNKPVFERAFKPKYYTVLKDFRLLIIPTKQILSMYDYGVLNGEIRICDEKAPQLFFVGDYELYMIAPFSALAFSVICLLLLLLVHALLPDLRTLPGLNLMSLSVAYLLWLSYYIAFWSLYGRVGTLFKPPCTSIKIAITFIQYAILMNAVVNVYHLKKTFCSTTLARSDEGKFKTFLKYCILSWGVPIIITIVYITLVKTGVVTFRLHMNLEIRRGYYCASEHNIPAWLNVCGSFVLPGLILLYIIVMFVFTAYRIHKKLKASSSIAQKSNIAKNRKSFVLLLKLMTPTATSWFLPVIILEDTSAMYDVHEAIVIPLYTLMLLTGVYVAVAFVFTRKNYQLLKKRYFPSKNTPDN